MGATLDFRCDRSALAEGTSRVQVAPAAGLADAGTPVRIVGRTLDMTANALRLPAKRGDLVARHVKGGSLDDGPGAVDDHAYIIPLTRQVVRGNCRAVAAYLYILRCADGTLYTGITTDPTRRVAQHNAGTASRYTRTRLPVVLVYRVGAATQSAALKREAAIKKLSRAEKELLIAAKKSRVRKAKRASAPEASRAAPRR